MFVFSPELHKSVVLIDPYLTILLGYRKQLGSKPNLQMHNSVSFLVIIEYHAYPSIFGFSG